MPSDRFASALFEPGFGGGISAALAMAVGLLVLAALGFAALTLVLRWWNRRRKARWKRLEKRWVSALLDVLAGDAPPASLQDRVEPADRSWFVDFLLRYSRRLRGEEREVIRELARPFLHVVVEESRARRPETRARAIRTLAILGLPEHEPEVIRALDDPSSTVSLAAARTLAETGDPRHAPAVLARLHRYEAWSADWLAQMIAAMGPAVVPHLETLYADPDAPDEVRAVSAEALVRIGAPSSADVAADVVASYSARDPGARELLIASLNLLGRVGRRPHLPLVRPLIAAPDAVVRARAAAVLGALGEEEDVPALTGALRDSDPWVALHAARALKRMNVTGPLEELLATDGTRADAAARADREELAREVLA